MIDASHPRPGDHLPADRSRPSVARTAATTMVESDEELRGLSEHHRWATVEARRPNRATTWARDAPFGNWRGGCGVTGGGDVYSAAVSAPRRHGVHRRMVEDLLVQVEDHPPVGRRGGPGAGE